MAVGYEVAYVEREWCGDDIVTVRFERPEGYEFAPGQWFAVRLETAEGPVTRTFSHSSAPSDAYLQLTTRLSESPFKRAMIELSPGQLVHVNGPGGRLALSDDVSRVAFLVGGVGVTPVRSILRDAKHRGRSFDDALLIYGNRDESCVPFLAELEDMADIGVRIVLIYEQPPAGWTGESGFITADVVRRHLDLTDGRPLVVTGPPVMVSAVEGVLDELKVPVERRMVERFGPAK